MVFRTNGLLFGRVRMRAGVFTTHRSWERSNNVSHETCLGWLAALVALALAGSTNAAAAYKEDFGVNSCELPSRFQKEAFSRAVEVATVDSIVQLVNPFFAKADKTRLLVVNVHGDRGSARMF